MKLHKMGSQATSPPPAEKRSSKPLEEIKENDNGLAPP
jgi:hypothetical protein